MIGRFAVSNYKSIRNRVEIFFAEGSSRMKGEHVSDDGCLRITSIFGANASGKSNLIKALKFIKRLITDPYYRTQYPACYWDSEDKISKFEIDFTIDDENGGYDTYTYSLDIATIGDRIDNISKQYFEYEVVNEKLEVTNRFGETIEIFNKKNETSRKMISKTLTEIESEQSKLDFYKDKLDSVNSEINSLNIRLSDIDQEYDLVFIYCKILYIILSSEEMDEDRVEHLSAILGHNWELKLNQMAEKIWDNKKNMRNNYVHNTDFIDYFPHSVSGLELFTVKSDRAQPSINDVLKKITRKELKNKFALVRDELMRMQGLDYTDVPVPVGRKKKSNMLNFAKSYRLLDNLEKQRKKISDSIESNEKSISPLNESIRNLVESIDSKRTELIGWKNANKKNLPVICTGDFRECVCDDTKNKIDDKTIGKIIEKTHTWFVSTLFILETDDYYLPINEPNLLDNLSGVLSSLDVGIDGLGWKNTYCDTNGGYLDVKDIDLIKSKLSHKDWERLDKCRKNSIDCSCSCSLIVKTETELNLFSYYMGEESVKKLVTYHNRDHDNYANIMSESDGTRRLIELASILLPTDTEKVFVVDELDRRLHPMLTLRFINLFLSDENKNKQLIFVTHESRLLTTEIFRPDEIWFMSMKDGASSLDSLDDIMRDKPKLFGKRTDKLYLEDQKLPGIPKIPKIEN